MAGLTGDTFVHEVPSTGGLIVLKPKKCPAAPKVQAKPPKPPTAPKPGRGASTPTPQPLPHPVRASLSFHLSSPEPRGLPGGLAKKLAVSSAQAFFPTTGKGPGRGVDARGASWACDMCSHTGPHTPKGLHLI